MRSSLLNLVKLSGVAVFVCLWLAPPAALSKGLDVRFRATVLRVVQTSDFEATVTVQLRGFEVPVLVNGDTEIELHGDEVGLDGLSTDDFVKIAAFFSPDGIVAEEIDILDRIEGQFRLRGLITAVGGTIGGTNITLLGVDVFVGGDTIIVRRGADGTITALDLETGMLADTAGFWNDGQFVATRIRVGSRNSDGALVEFEGVISSIREEIVLVDTEGGGLATVILTDATRIGGTPEVDAFVEVKGFLDENLAVVATVIKVDDDGDRDADDDNPERGPNSIRTRRTQGLDRLGGPSVEDVEGEVEVDFRADGDGDKTQEVRVHLRNAARNSEFGIRVELVSGEVLELGTGRTDNGGRLDARFRELEALLPSGRTVSDILRIQIIRAGDVVLDATVREPQ